jgi:ATPase family associated with various cellular activities (AAA)
MDGYGTPRRLAALGERFGLSTFDLDVLLACLAAELDPAGEPRSLTVGALLGEFCAEAGERAAGWRRFGPAAPLVSYGLLGLGAGGPVAGRAVWVQPRVAAWLLGDDAPDPAVAPYLREVPRTAVPAAVAPAGVLDRLRALAADGCVLYLRGPAGTGRRTAAAAVAEHPVLAVDGVSLAALEPADFDVVLRLVDREARLAGAALYWSGWDALLDRPGRLAAALRAVLDQPGAVFLAGSAEWEPARDVPVVRLDFAAPDATDRAALWLTTLGRTALGTAAPSQDVLAELAGRFRLTAGGIADAAATAGALALARDPAAPVVTEADLYEACRRRCGVALAALATRVTPRHGWDDLVLPAGPLAQLREVYDQARHRALVHDGWGFGARLSTGRGLAVLFAGPPGTGKTMAADVLAGALRLDLYRVELPSVLSKYIGETEQNLDRIFTAARTSNAILFFDEADALFGKRTAVRDAHDRYANVETSYLLQQLDEYDGIVIAATNLRKNLDEAFARRLASTVDFALPSRSERRRIWAGVWPAAIPLGSDVDLDVLSELDVSGGSIRNIALAAAFLAAAEGATIGMDHLLHASRRELRKLGSVLGVDPRPLTVPV